MFVENTVDDRKERSRVKNIYWAVVLIWAGLILGVNGLGLLPEIGNADAWAYVITGVGLIGTLMNISYASSSDTLNPTNWDWIWSGFWLIVGLGGFLNLEIFWPLAFILIGVVALITAIRTR